MTAILEGLKVIDRGGDEAAAIEECRRPSTITPGFWTIAASAASRSTSVLAKCLGREELATDPRFADRGSRANNSTVLIAELDAAFAARDSADWRALVTANALVFEAVATMDQVASDPQMRETDVLLPFEGDTMLTINSPFFVTGVEKVRPRKPPEPGGHNEPILREAGYDDAAIAQLRADKAIG